MLKNIMNIRRQVLGLSFVLLLCCSIVVGTLSASAEADCLGENSLAVFASQWIRSDCAAPDWCLGADMDMDSDVDLADFAAGFGPCEPLTLVEAGVSRVSIHNLSVGTPSLVEQYAAQQLRIAFQYATGVAPAINPATAAEVQIKLGTAARFAVGIGNSHPQAYCMRRTLDGNIELVANSQAGVLWAVDGFCRDVLQVMWPVADDQITRVGPQQSTLTVGAICKTDAPDFVRRGWIIGDNSDGFHYNDEICNMMAHTRQNIIYNPASQLASVRDKKKQHGIEPDTSMHSFWWLVPADEYWPQDELGNDLVNDPKYHPEYFPLIDGSRKRPDNPSSIYVQLCLSNPDILNIVLNKAAITIAAYPEMNVFGVCHNDGHGGWCQCANCIALDGDQAGTGNYSNRMIWFANQVADAVSFYYSDKYIGTYAYGETVVPPTIPISDYVAITFCPGGRNLLRKLTDPTDTINAGIMANLSGWLTASNHVRFWEYYYYSGLARCAAPYSRTFCDEFKELYALGLEGMCSETYPVMWPGMSLLSYTFSRVSWDTSLTYDTIMSDYCQERYGPAAATMESYHRLYEDTIYDEVPALTSVGGAGEQLLPNAFTTAEINSLDAYLTTAADTVAANGTAYHVNAVTKERDLFEEFQRLTVDPATIPGIGPNLVSNPGAESGSANWSTNIQRGNYAFSTPTGGAHSGSRSFQIACTGTPGWSRWYRPLTGLTPGKRYAVRHWIYAESGASGEIWVYGGTPQLKQGFTVSDGQWVMLVCPEITANSDSFSLYVNSFGTGTIRFDDVFIAELPDE